MTVSSGDAGAVSVPSQALVFTTGKLVHGTVGDCGAVSTTTMRWVRRCRSPLTAYGGDYGGETVGG